MVDQLNYEGIEFPVAIKHYCKIEGQNNINIYVFGYENKQFYPIYVSKQYNENVLNLLLITEDEKQHYVLFKDFNSLMYNKTKHRERKHFCMHCLQCFSTEEILSKHKTNCMILNGEQAIRIPQKGNNVLQFENYHKQMPVPFAIYADFEAIIEKVQGCQPSGEKSYTDKYQKHTACSYGYKVVCCYDDKYTKAVQIYRGEDSIKRFMQEMLNPKEFKIPVIFHNLRGYDSHFIMQEIGNIGKEHDLETNCIPNNMEKYMAFMLGKHLIFLDSFQFMASSLERLAANLPKEAYIYTSKVFKGEKFNLMKQKGVYPYDYMDSVERFNDQQLPSKDEFYSILTDEGIRDEQYTHAQNVWDISKLKNMGEYHDLYLKSDILLLADIFENFRKTCLQYYNVDPAHYFTSPGLSWDAMLKMTGIKRELMTDVDMFQFIEKGMRGGISYISHRYGKANNKYMKDYDSSGPSKFTMYLDMNNLYGASMSQCLPTGGFKWLTQKKISKINLGTYTADGKKGLILEVDLQYPSNLHNLHNDYPLWG